MGQGKKVYQDKHVYVGALYHGQKHGLGTQKYADGGLYEGEFQRDRRHGRGKKVTPGKDSYVGSWQNNVRHGQGKVTCTKGVAEGEFRHNWMYNGKGVIMHSNGSTGEGEWIQGILHGTLTNVDGVVKEGTFAEKDIFVKKVER